MTPRKVGPGPLRVLGYVRVSTEEQAHSGAGLAAQREAILNTCKVRGYRLLEIIEETNGVSAKSLERPGIVRALAELDAGRSDALMVAKLDRLSRSVKDFAELTERARVGSWSIVALDLGVDTTTPQGEAMANVSAVFAQLERRLIGERTKAALAVKKAQGVRLGRPVHPKVLEALPRMIEQSKQGWTLQRIADDLTARGVPTSQGGAVAWRPSSVRTVLHGPDAKRLGWVETPRHRHGGRRAL